VHATSLVDQFARAGISWRAYMEGLPRPCFTGASSGDYAKKHDPFVYYASILHNRDLCGQVVPLDRLVADEHRRALPRFVWITPNLCHDGHDCTNATVNEWLSQTVPVILRTDAWQDNGVLFITWDEGEDNSNSVLTLVIHSNPVKHQSTVAYDHYSLLASIEDLLGVPRLGDSAQANPMTDLLQVRPSKAPPRLHASSA